MIYYFYSYLLIKKLMLGDGQNFFIQNPKSSFIIGAAAGIGVFTTIGFIILLANFFGDGEDASKKNTNSGSNNAVVAAPTPSAPTPTGPVDVAVSDGDYIKGNPDAKVTIIEFSDYQCPFCQRFHPTVQQALDEYGDDVRWVYKHFPLDSIHPEARPSANAAECAGEQGKFWEYSDELFANQTRLGTPYYKSLAVELGIGGSNFDDCVDSGKYDSKVDADYQQGLAAGVQGTPATFINGRLISGAQPYSALKSAIDSAL